MRIMALLGAIAAVGCSPGGTSDEAAGADSPGVRLYVFNCGEIDVLNLSVFDRAGSYDGRQDSFVDTCYLVRHPKGDLLWDAGMPDAIHDMPDGVSSGDFKIRVPKTLIGQLAEVGLTPADIEYLSISHSHFDHVGNAGAFAASTLIIHEDELQHMFRDEARADAQSFASYSALEGAKHETFADERDVFGDGAVRIIAAPGHTPGHSVLLVSLATSGPVLLSGDLYHLTEARERRTIPAFNTDADETLRSMEKFEALAADTGARVVIQHEDEDYASLPHAPAFLD